MSHSAQARNGSDGTIRLAGRRSPFANAETMLPHERLGLVAVENALGGADRANAARSQRTAPLEAATRVAPRQQPGDVAGVEGVARAGAADIVGGVRLGLQPQTVGEQNGPATAAGDDHGACPRRVEALGLLPRV